MKVLLTGASGLLGTYLSNTWSNLKDIQLTTLSRSPLSGRHICHDLKHPLDNPPPLDAVIHAAAVVDESDSANYELFVQNLKFANHAAEIALASRANMFINISSTSVYGRRRTGRVTESDPALPDSYYSLSKKLSEELIDFVIGKAMAVSHFRLGYVLTKPLPDRYFISRILKKIRAGEEVELLNPEETRFSFIDVVDIERVLRFALLAKAEGVFNLVEDSFPKLIEVARFLENQAGVPMKLELIHNDKSILCTDISNRKIKADLKFDRFLKWQESLAS